MLKKDKENATKEKKEGRKDYLIGKKSVLFTQWISLLCNSLFYAYIMPLVLNMMTWQFLGKYPFMIMI